MERIISTEDKIRRAEEIYNNRKIHQARTGTTKVSLSEKKDIKLFKKMAIQIVVCLALYSVFYLIKNNNYVFSEDFINMAKQVLSYDENFQEIYSKIINTIQTNNITQEENNKEEQLEINTENTEDNGIGGAEENNEQKEEQQATELTQMEQDAISIKKSISFINPIEGTITSRFGWRSPTTNTVPKYHTGLDIANISGTKIHSATEGDVILTSSKGD